MIDLQFRTLEKKQAGRSKMVQFSLLVKSVSFGWKKKSVTNQFLRKRWRGTQSAIKAVKKAHGGVPVVAWEDESDEER